MTSFAIPVVYSGICINVALQNVEEMYFYFFLSIQN